MQILGELSQGSCLCKNPKGTILLKQLPENKSNETDTDS